MTTAIVPYQESTVLQKLEKAKQCLAECRTLEDVKKIRDIAEAAKVYAKAAHLSKEAQEYAAEVSLLATHKAGEILRQLPRSSPKENLQKGAKSPMPPPEVSGYQKTLEETKTPRKTAEKWERLSEIPEKEVKKYIEEAKKAEEPITQSGLVASIQQPKTEPKKTKTEAISLLVSRIDGLVKSLNKIVSLKHQFSSSELRKLAVACRDAKFDKLADKLES